MIKKFLSVILSISMLLSMVSVVNVFAAQSEHISMDISSKNLGDKVSGGYVVEKDGRKALVINNKSAYSDGTVSVTPGDAVSLSKALPSGTKGIVIDTTFMLDSASPNVMLMPGTGVYPRYLDLSGGSITTDPNSSTNLSTGLTYATNNWYRVIYKLNYTTGYYNISFTNLNTNATTVKTGTDSKWIKTDEDLQKITTIRWWHTANKAGNMYVSDFKVYTENNADEIAPSRIVVRDDFDSSETTVSSPWTSTTSLVETDRGNSAEFGSTDGTSMTVSNTGGLLNSAAKGLVIEFSTKLAYTSTKPNFVVSLNGNWYTANNKLLQFTNGNNGVCGQGGSTSYKILSSWSKDKWYDVRIEISFDSAGSASYRYIVNDGTNETVKVYENVSTTLFDTISSITKIQFTYATGDGKAYVDNVNIYWLDSASASGISKTYISNPVNVNLESYAEGDVDECKEAFSTYSGTASYTVESVKDSGRGKSLKISTSDTSAYEFYKENPAIQYGSISFDIMFPEISGETIIQTQKSTANNNYESPTWFLRFDKWGNVENGTGQTPYGTYEAGKWYKLILTAGSDASTSEGYQDFELIDESGTSITKQRISLGKYTTADSFLPYDSIRQIRFLMTEGPHSIYIDNFKMYKPAATPAGIYPVNQTSLKESVVCSDNKFVLPFSKPVDLAKSSFTVNGEAATVTGYEYITLNTVIKEGEEYVIEYTVYDMDGFKTEGYISGITAESVFTVSSLTEATLSAPTAIANVKVSEVADSKDVKLYVAAYLDGEMIALDMDSQTLKGTSGSFTATVDATGADEIKTFLWDGKTLTPIK